MGSCVSAQGEGGKSQSKDGKKIKAKQYSPDTSRTSSHDQSAQGSSISEAIDSNEEMKEKLEEQIESLEQELKETRYVSWPYAGKV